MGIIRSQEDLRIDHLEKRVAELEARSMHGIQDNSDDAPAKQPQNVAPPISAAPGKAEFWRAWAIDGMPADKQRLAEAAWKAGAEAELQRLRKQEPVGWNFQNRETGICTELTNDGINNPENFLPNNPRFDLIGALYAEPVPPPDVRQVDDAAFEKSLEDRDYYHEMADKLADVVGALLGINVGEHSSINCPWETALNAYEYMEPPNARELAEALQGLLDALPSATTHPAIKSARAALAKLRGQP